MKLINISIPKIRYKCFFCGNKVEAICTTRGVAFFVCNKHAEEGDKMIVAVQLACKPVNN